MQGESDYSRPAEPESRSVVPGWGERALSAPSSTSELLLATERERRRIAALLHDDVGQTLAVALMRLEAASGKVAPDVAALLGDARDAVGTALDAVRSLTVQLSPPILHERGLLPALSWLGSHLLAPMGVRVEESLEPPPQLPQAVAAVIFQSVREAYINVLKHARAKVVILRAFGDDSAFHLVVQDDGVGLEASRGPQGSGNGFGLFDLREQVGLIGGTLEVESEPGRFTRLRVTVPLAGRASASGQGKGTA